jgi:hypothetical protein
MADPVDLPLAALVAAPLPADAPDHARRLVERVGRAAPTLLRMDDAASSSRPAPGKWSSREIIGHLIDSASNNHQRFVRMSGRDDLVVDGQPIAGMAERGIAQVAMRLRDKIALRELSWPNTVPSRAAFTWLSVSEIQRPVCGLD